MNIYDLREKIVMDKYISCVKHNNEPYLRMIDVLDAVERCEKDLIPVIPLFIAEHIERSKSRNLSLVDTMNEASSFDNVRIWLKGHINQDMFAKAWTVGYIIDRESKYEVVKDQYSFKGWLTTKSLHPDWDDGAGILFHKEDATNLAKLVGGEIRPLEDRR